MNNRVATKVTLKIKRPNGEIEYVVPPTLKSVTPAQFRQIQAATMAADRGEVLGYNVEYKDVGRPTIKSSSDLFYAGAERDTTTDSMSRMGE